MQEDYKDSELNEQEVPETVRMRSNIPNEREGVTGGEESAFDLAGLLQGAGYPATKEDLIDYATDQGAEDYVIQMLDQLPDTTYNSPAEVSQAIGESTD
jgi:hypothetical protein